MPAKLVCWCWYNVASVSVFLKKFSRRGLSPACDHSGVPLEKALYGYFPTHPDVKRGISIELGVL